MKLTRRRVWITATVFAFVAALSLIIVLVFGGDRITQANVDRIQIGMTWEQVWAILGPPTGTITVSGSDTSAAVLWYSWQGNSGVAFISFDRFTVTEKSYLPDQSTWWSRLKRFFGL